MEELCPPRGDGSEGTWLVWEALGGCRFHLPRRT